MTTRIHGGTKLLGLLGQGVSHTLSPLIHNVSAEHLGIDNAYVPFDMPAVSVPSFLKVFWEMGGVGFNVTTPHKQLVASLLPGHLLESVNTVFRGPEGWQATSTDGEGFSRALDRLGTPLGGFSKIVMLGNGGAVLAILGYLAQHFEGHAETVLLRRKTERDELIRKMMPKPFHLRFRGFTVDALMEELQGRAGDTLLVQGTNAPIRGDDLKGFSPALDQYRGVFVDLVYGTPSHLYTKARERGLLSQDGLPMLIEQARLSQEYWWRRAAPYDVIFEAIRAARSGHVVS